jgi:hypothetical protein
MRLASLSWVNLGKRRVFNASRCKGALLRVTVDGRFHLATP